MPKNKRPVPRKSSQTVEDKDDALPQSLADLALELVEREEGSSELPEKEVALHKLIRKLLQQKNDEVLYDAIERAKYADVDAYQYLRGHIEEASSTVVVRREGKPAMEINAFVVPLFVRSTGGLIENDGFFDSDAFSHLVQSFQQGGLESEQAKVVLINHAYDLGEIDRITYSHLGAMVRDAFASMTDKKIVATPALDDSIVGWSGARFGADDVAVELRFLLGFALKREDDPFYAVPHDEVAADAYFSARMERYQQWTEQAAPLVRRLMAANPESVDINFLYQDLFHGGKEQGMAEYAMLQMMADINHALREHKTGADQVRAIVGPTDVRDAMVLRVNLYARDGDAVLASSDKPLDLAADMQVEVDDICDALGTIGITSVAVAMKFDRDGKPVDAQPYQPAGA
jgi:hypothetical protein